MVSKTKAKSTSISAGSLLKPFSIVIRNFHLTLFFVVVIAGLVGAVILINRTIADSQDEGTNYQSTINAGSIDEATLQRLQSLQPSGEPRANEPLPGGRINPFNE